jgi:hypothetical protein
MTFVHGMLRKEYDWNCSVLQRVHLSNLVKKQVIALLLIYGEIITAVLLRLCQEPGIEFVQQGQ